MRLTSKLGKGLGDQVNQAFGEALLRSDDGSSKRRTASKRALRVADLTRLQIQTSRSSLLR